jgi:hypothetical protein
MIHLQAGGVMTKAMVLVFIPALAFSGCIPYYYEPNPHIYYDVACEIDEGGAAKRFETSMATFTCSPRIDPAECNGGYYGMDAGAGDGPAIPHDQLCRCRGVYKLGFNSFSIEVDGLSVASGGVFSTSDGTIKRAAYKGAEGTAELYTTVRSWKNFSCHDYHCDNYEFDLIFAGGFTADFGSTKIKGCYFYPIDPSGRS